MNKENINNQVIGKVGFSKVDSIELLLELSRASETVNQVYDKFYKKFKLTRVQFKALYFLYLCTNEGIALSSLSEKLDITRPSVTTLIDRMVSSGLAKRFADEGDRRSIRAIITEKGKQIMDEVLPNTEVFQLSILDFLDEEEKQNLYKLIVKIRQELTDKFL